MHSHRMMPLDATAQKVTNVATFSSHSRADLVFAIATLLPVQTRRAVSCGYRSRLMTISARRF
jgi:hypothetical protein